MVILIGQETPTKYSIGKGMASAGEEDIPTPGYSGHLTGKLAFTFISPNLWLKLFVARAGSRLSPRVFTGGPVSFTLAE